MKNDGGKVLGAKVNVTYVVQRLRDEHRWNGRRIQTRVHPRDIHAQ